MLPGLRFSVRAPLRYDAREFLIYQYTCLCQAVLADVRLNPASFVHHVVIPLLLPKGVRPGTLLRAASGAVLLALSGALAYRAATGAWPVPVWSHPQWDIVGAAAAALAAVIAFGWRTRQALIEVRQIITLAIDAKSRLERLHYQRTDSRSQGGTLRGPIGTAVNFTSTRAFVEQVMTLPELIDDYRDFVQRVVAALQRSPGGGRPGKSPTESRHGSNLRLVIGIDEMDRIGDATEANRFLNELGSVFGTPHSVYLISVSPDVLTTTDQLKVPLRAASGGVFDELIWVEPLDLKHAGDLLDRRVIGLPAGFIALCYVLSGGLPRDLLRIARAVFTIDGRGHRGEIELARAAEHVIGDEIRALKIRAMTHVASLDIPAVPDLLEVLTKDDWPLHRPVQTPGDAGAMSVEVRTILGELSQLWAGTARQKFVGPDQMVDPGTAEICDSFLAALYFLLTVHQIFAAESSTVTKIAANCIYKVRRPTGGDQTLNDLARVHTALSVNPYLAWASISRIRDGITRWARHPDAMADIEPDFLGIEHRRHALQSADEFLIGR